MEVFWSLTIPVFKYSNPEYCKPQPPMTTQAVFDSMPCKINMAYGGFPTYQSCVMVYRNTANQAANDLLELLGDYNAPLELSKKWREEHPQEPKNNRRYDARVSSVDAAKHLDEYVGFPLYYHAECYAQGGFVDAPWDQLGEDYVKTQWSQYYPKWQKWVKKFQVYLEKGQINSRTRDFDFRQSQKQENKRKSKNKRNIFSNNSNTDNEEEDEDIDIEMGNNNNNNININNSIEPGPLPPPAGYENNSDAPISPSPSNSPSLNNSMFNLDDNHNEQLSLQVSKSPSIPVQVPKLSAEVPKSPSLSASPQLSPVNASKSPSLSASPQLSPVGASPISMSVIIPKSSVQAPKSPSRSASPPISMTPPAQSQEYSNHSPTLAQRQSFDENIGYVSLCFIMICIVLLCFIMFYNDLL